MDLSTIGRSVDDFLKRCPQCNREYTDQSGRHSTMYYSCGHVVCQNCRDKSPKTCPVCLKPNQYAISISFEKRKNLLCTAGFRVLTKDDQEKIEHERTRYEDKIKELKMKKNAATGLKKEDQDKMKLFEDKIKELEMEKKAATKLKEQFATEKKRLEMELKTEKIKTKTENEKVKKVSFTCSECDFPVAEYRSHICIDCGLSSGFLTKEGQNLRLNADTQQIENENLMCVGCAIEGVHAGHQTVNYQQLKERKFIDSLEFATLEPISIEKKKAKDTELAEKRDTVVNSQTMITVARLLQTARVELSKLSEETVNAVTWDEFNLTWNSADIELSRAYSITENFLNVADDTEKTLEKVVAGLGAIRTGCKVFVKNSGKADISKGANCDEIKADCSASDITDASDWEALSDSSGKSDQKGEI